MRVNDKKLDLSTPAVMGILNLTPDSFFDGGKYRDEKAVLSRVEKMITEGASIVDIGAASTRPGADLIKFTEEKTRLLPYLTSIRKTFPEIILSIDTYNSETAKAAFNEGADMINDVSGGDFDHKMFKTISEIKIPYVLMHTKGTPAEMQQNAVYEDVVKEMLIYFEEKIKTLSNLGVHEIFIDPGFGFAKKMEHNYTLLKKLSEFKIFQLPLIAGVSRKGMIHKLLNIKASESLAGTTAVHTIALLNGAKILRVHDVKEAMQSITITNYYLKQKE